MITARRNQTRLFAQYFLDSIEIPEGTSTLLDVGCAYGDALFEIERRFPDIHLMGMDIEAQHILGAKQIYPGFEFIQGDIFHLPNLSWDVIYCSNVLEHFYRAKALKAAKILSNRCSTLFIMAPYLDSTVDPVDDSTDDGEVGTNWEGHRWILDETSFGRNVPYHIIDTPGAWHYKQIIYQIKGLRP